MGPDRISSDHAVMQKPSVRIAHDERAELSDLMLYWRGVMKRKWLILTISFALAAVAAAVSFMITPIYRATATVLIEQNRARVVAVEEVYSGIAGNREHFETQADILGSRALASRVIEKLGLRSHPEFDPRQQKPPLWHKVADRVGITLSPKREISEQQIDAAVLATFMRRMTVEPARLSQLIRVSFDSPDPQFAAFTANAIVDAYIEGDVETRYGMTKRATEWLQERLSGLKRELEQSERVLQQYREREQIVETRGLAQSGASRQVEELTRALVDARRRRAEADAAYKQTREARNPESLPVIQRSPLMTRLKELEAEAEKKVAEFSKRYGPEHPRMIQAQSELRQARESTQRQIGVMVSSLANEYEAARVNEIALERSLAEAKSHVQGINRKEFQLLSLERAVAANRQLYETFLSRFKETSTAAGVQSNAVARLVDPALPPDTPVKPKKRHIVSIVFVLALFFAVCGAIFRERLDTTVQSPRDVEEKIGEPMLAMLPLLRGSSSKAMGRHFLSDSASAFAEGIRTARTGVLLSGLGTPQKALLVTSSLADEGKSVVAANLALAYAQTQRVLLVDADLHQPSLAAQLALDPTRPGLTDLFSGAASFADCLQRVSGSSLYVLPTGSPPRDALELMLSPRFPHLLNALTNACDLVIIDSPPMHLFSDALVLASMVDGVVFVVKAGSTSHQLARHSLDALRSVNAKTLGVILNQLDFKKAERYHGAYVGNYEDYYPTSGSVAPRRQRLSPVPAKSRILTASKVH